jgi:hypothetical protein
MAVPTDFKKTLAAFAERNSQTKSYMGEVITAPDVDGKCKVRVSGSTAQTCLAIGTVNQGDQVMVMRFPLSTYPVVVGSGTSADTAVQSGLPVTLNAIGLTPNPLDNVSGLTAVWAEDDLVISWDEINLSSLFYAYRLSIDGVERFTQDATFTYTKNLNKSDHAGNWQPSLVVSVTTVNIFAEFGAEPATLTATWERPDMPNIVTGSAVWQEYDCLISWEEPVKPYTFVKYLVTIGAVTFAAFAASFTYTRAMNEADNNGTMDTTLEISVVAADRDNYVSHLPLVINTSWTASPMPNVTGLTGAWQEFDLVLNWNAVTKPYDFDHYKITIGSVAPTHIHTTTAEAWTYTKAMNQSDHNGNFSTGFLVRVVAAGASGVESVIPATDYIVWVAPDMPDVIAGSASWQQDDCLIAWDEPVGLPYTFQWYILTIDGVTYTSVSRNFTYTNSMNRNDHDGIMDPYLTIEIVAEGAAQVSPVPYGINATNVDPTGDTIRDNFDTYGGDEVAQGGNGALYWLSLIEGEGDADEVFNDPAHGHIDGHSVVQGETAAYLDRYTNDIYKVGVFDLTQESRFTVDDFLVFSVYVQNTTPRAIAVEFVDGHGAFAGWNGTASVAGWHYYAIKRSDLSTGGSFDWTDVVQIRCKAYGSSNEIWFDDVRIVKADPTNSSTYNDTGAAWYFSGGAWHIYQDVPSVPFALGQIDTTVPGTRETAWLQGEYTISNHVAAGVYLREEGKAGLLAFGTYSNSGYEVQIDTAGDTLKLIKWEAGVDTELGSYSLPLESETRYTLGVQRDQYGFVDVYLAEDAQTIFTADTLKMRVEDSTYLSGWIGLISYGANTRFFNVRGGSPEHALMSEFAVNADMLDGMHASDLLAAAANAHSGQALFTAEGGLSVAPGKIRIYNRLGRTVQISNVFAAVGMAPTGANIMIDIHKNGSSIFASPADRTTIAASANTGEHAFSTTVAWAADEYLTMDIDQVGSTTPGSDLSVHITYS